MQDAARAAVTLILLGSLMATFSAPPEWPSRLAASASTHSHPGAPQEPSAAGLAFANVRPNAATVGLYEKFELTFDVLGSVATVPDFPFDPAPPPGVPAGVGITVEGLFSPDDWATTHVQPAFRYQGYQSRCIGGSDPVTCRGGRNWLYPEGNMVWKVRFAPQQAGTWRYRLRATDASGTVESEEGTFTAVPSSHPENHGFVRLSRADPGYFEYSDGTPFIGVGHGTSFDSERFRFHVDEEMARFAAFRVNFLRAWMTGSSIYMAPWAPWHSHHLPGEGGYFNPSSLTYAQAYADHLFSLRLWDYPDPAVEGRRNPCMFQGFANDIAVKPSTTYQLLVRVRTVGVTGPRDRRYPHGFTARLAGWLGEACADPAATGSQSRRLLDHRHGTNAWDELTATFTTGPEQWFLDNLYLILENTTGGDAYVDEVSLREVVAGQPTGPELLRKNRFAYQRYFDPLPAWQWDYIFEQAEANGVTIRPVVLEKNDWIANHLNANGQPTGEYYELDNNRFYAAPRTAVRRYHEYFWRYLIARWGYSRAVHSWELLNEGDPYNGNHYAMADAFGRFMRAHDPHRHPATTSTWHSFPQVEFWANPTYAGVDYADVHEYACCGNRYAGWARSIDEPLALEERAEFVVGGRGASVRIPGRVQFNNAGGTPRSLAIRGRGEWLLRFQMKAQGFVGQCEFGLPNSLAGPRLLWILDDQRSSVVPPPAEAGKSWLCTAPAGTYDWRSFDSQHTHDGRLAPAEERIILNDDELHSLAIYFQNGFGTAGQAWIDQVELIAPDGREVYMNGEFDPTVLWHDAAHLSASLSRQIGGRTPSGPGKPVTRGEVALGDQDDYRGDERHDQSRDTRGVWLHTFLWAQLNPGGLYELYWDPALIRRFNLYGHFRSFRNFMDGVPLNNGRYRDARASASHPDLIVLGQVDRSAGWGHLYVRHRQYTWRNVVDGRTIPPLSGSVVVPDMREGDYQVTWWDTWQGKPRLSQVAAAAAGKLELVLPDPLAEDIAVKFAPLTEPERTDQPEPTATASPTRPPQPTVRPPTTSPGEPTSPSESTVPPQPTTRLWLPFLLRVHGIAATVTTEPTRSPPASWTASATWTPARTAPPTPTASPPAARTASPTGTSTRTPEVTHTASPSATWTTSPTRTEPPTPSATPTSSPSPTEVTPPAPPAMGQEWSQHAHDAQHTGYTDQSVAYPWRLRWIWNGVDARGRVRKVTTGGSLPRNVQPVTGDGRVYVAAGSDGVFALSEASGAQLWQRSGIGDIRSTVAYDRDTQAVFALSADGTLYRLRASDGAVAAQYASGKRSDLPLPPAVIGDRVLFSMGNAVFAIDKATMAALWIYDAGATVAVPPAYSPSRDLVIVATEPDLFVHAIRNSDGRRQWRVRPVHPSLKFEDPTEYRYGWPVIAESAGYVLVKVRLHWEAVWRDWPQTNEAMRRFLTENPDQQALFVLDLDDGRTPFIAHVGHGGYGDGGYLPMGPQPVVKRLPSGKEIVYTVIRAKHAHDARWDSHFGEMVLDDTTVPDLLGGYVRFIRFDWPPGSSDPFLLTDEQPNVTMAGEYLFGGHWEAGFAARILDRSDSRGSFRLPITSERLATVVTSQDDVDGCAFSSSHYCPSNLTNTRQYDFGFYIYYNQGPVYDEYWSEYAVFVPSNDNLYFRSCDGAIVALTSGEPTASSEAARARMSEPGGQWLAAGSAGSTNGSPGGWFGRLSLLRQAGRYGQALLAAFRDAVAAQAEVVIAPAEARAWAGRTVTVKGKARYVFNNGKYLLVGFANPHRGAFKILIHREHWPAFEGRPDAWFRVGQMLEVRGVVRWYQGDPAIFVTAPDQLRFAK